MAETEVDIYNLAVAQLGVESSIGDRDEESREAELCRLFYDTVRRKLLAAAPWSFAKKSRRLTLISEAEDTWADTMPEPEWAFAYQRPVDMVYPRFTSQYSRFILGNVGDQPAIMSGEENIILTYTFDAKNVALWSPWFVDAMYFGLAAHIARPLTGKRDLTGDLLNLANQHVLTAREIEGNADNQTLETLPPWLNARGAGGPVFPDRYIYPVGPLLGGVSSG
jgi:hypothetical protein